MGQEVLSDEIYSTQVEYYMRECFDLAKKSLGRTSPNPAVGAIVLDKNGMPVGKGFHKKAGLEHAEVLAIREAGDLAKDGTLIINLEPCCHIGKTPSCVDLILKTQIKEVIFSNYDPNPLVNGKGEKILLENNIKVIPNVLDSLGLETNKFFFKWIKTKLPWVTLKQAQTLDGKVASGSGKREWISSENSRCEVHKLRNIYDAVLVGANTVQIDNPELTVRNLNGVNGENENEIEVRNPTRIVLDKNLITKPNSNVYKNDALVFLITKKGHSEKKINNYISFNEKLTIIELADINLGRFDLKDLFLELSKRNILSVLVEAGPNLATELITNNLIDEYILFISPKFLSDKNGVPSIKIDKSQNIKEFPEFNLFNYKATGNDLMVSLRTS